MTRINFVILYFLHCLIFSILASLPPDDLVTPATSVTHRGYRGHQYPPPMSPNHEEGMDGMENVSHNMFPTPGYSDEPYLPKLEQGDEFYLGSDEEDDWDDFEDVCCRFFFNISFSRITFHRGVSRTSAQVGDSKHLDPLRRRVFALAEFQGKTTKILNEILPTVSEKAF